MNAEQIAKLDEIFSRLSLPYSVTAGYVDAGGQWHGGTARQQMMDSTSFKLAVMEYTAVTVTDAR